MSALSLHPPDVAKLTEVQQQICALKILGKSNKTIGSLLDMSLRMVELNCHKAREALDLGGVPLIVWAAIHREHLPDAAHLSRAALSTHNRKKNKTQ